MTPKHLHELPEDDRLDDNWKTNFDFVIQPTA